MRREVLARCPEAICRRRPQGHVVFTPKEILAVGGNAQVAWQKALAYLQNRAVPKVKPCA